MRTSWLVSLFVWAIAFSQSAADEQIEFFESRIRPVLVEHCYKCHNSVDDENESELALDWRQPIRSETDNGTVVSPGNASQSLLLRVIKHEIDGLEMPDGGPKLEPQVIADFEKWIASGAVDPRDKPPTADEIAQATSWETTLEKRKQWWSFQPIANVRLPLAADHPVDWFIQKRLKQEGLLQSHMADERTLLRRLTFVITGLPPTREQMEAFADVDTKKDYEAFVQGLLDSDAFGERWARHFMDLVRYSDSHGSEGDPTIPHTHRYRNYLIRAFNADVPYDQLVREHIAGDLLESPRVNEALGLNESAIGPGHWRMVFHGFAPTDALDEKVRFVDDQINVFSKAFLGLTVSCARCHDHKFDAISQADYYALFGVLGSCRPALVDANTKDRQQLHSGRLREIKAEIKTKIAATWSDACSDISNKLKDETWSQRVEEAKDGNALLNLLHEINKRTKEGKSFENAWSEVANTWHDAERKTQADRDRENEWYSNLATDEGYKMWFGEGNGLPSKPYEAGDFVLLRDGDDVVERILPGGVHSHSISRKHRGFLASKRLHLDDETDVWFHVAGQGGPSARYSVQHYPRNGTVYPIRSVDKADHYLLKYGLGYWTGDDVHFEVATAPDAPIHTRNNNDSWFSLREVIVRKKSDPDPVRNSREFLAPIFAAAEKAKPNSMEDIAKLFEQALSHSISAWASSTAHDAQAMLIDRALQGGLIPNNSDQNGVKALLVEYRELENQIPQPTRVPGLAESEAWDHPLFDRGNHKKPLEPVSRRFLEAIDSKPFESPRSGRLELADAVLAPDNPLTTRVIANRIWHYTFGNGIVATPDNFGKLGAKPSHPELLDYLANRFVKDGWSFKRAIKFLVTSDTWKAAWQASPAAQQLDPGNQLLSHANLRRLDAEAIRDSILATAGRLDREMYGGTVDTNGRSNRRSVYVRTRRNSLDQFLSTFDAPVPFATKGKRDATNVPAQSLTMMNDPFVKRMASEWANSERVKDENENRVIAVMFETAFGRPARDNELDAMVNYVKDLTERIEQYQSRRSAIDNKMASAKSQLEAMLEPVRKRLSGDKKSSGIQLPDPVGHWDFKQGLDDQVGEMNGELRDGAKIENGKLILRGRAYLATKPGKYQLREKTLVARLRLDTLDQQGGGAISVQTNNGVKFDSIVFAERQARHWMPGSENFKRTDDVGGPQESLTDDAVHMAIAYDKDGTIRMYRNGMPYGKPIRKSGIQKYKKNQWQVVLGIRHGDATRLRCDMHEAALFDRALTAEQIAALALGANYVSKADILAALTDSQKSQYDELTETVAKAEAELVDLGEPVDSGEAWTRLAHAMFNMKEFIYLK